MMIKRGASGHIEELVEDGQAKEQVSPDIQWNTEILIKDVLVVPTRSETAVDLDLDEEEEDEIAVRV